MKWKRATVLAKTLYFNNYFQLNLFLIWPFGPTWSALTGTWMSLFFYYNTYVCSLFTPLLLSFLFTTSTVLQQR